jgi:cytochrome o ubiquinol oxidase subunit 1
LVATVISLIIRSYDNDTDYYVPAAEVERIENLHIQAKAKAKQDLNHDQ